MKTSNVAAVTLLLVLTLSLYGQTTVLTGKPKTFTSIHGASIDISAAMDMPQKPTWTFYLKSGKHSDDPTVKDSVMFDLNKNEIRRLDAALVKFAKWDAQATSTNMESGFTKLITYWIVEDTALDIPVTLFVHFNRKNGADTVDIFTNVTDKTTGVTTVSGSNFTPEEAADIKQFIDGQLIASGDPNALDALKNEHKPGDELK
jgi:hypothetical protein